jgi:uncharacterized protein with HEPN domain
MRPEKLYLSDILEAIRAITIFSTNVKFSQFEGNDMLRSAILQKLSIIGEAAARLPDDFYTRYPDIPWLDMINFRNIAVHEYFAVNWEIVWDTAVEDIPPLEEKIRKILEQYQ